MRQIYLDYNASTPIAAAVQEAILPFLAEHYGNPSSGHALGRASQEALEDARGRVAALLRADCDELVFTSGGTEANNLAIFGVLNRFAPRDAHFIISAFEHAAVSQCALAAQRRGFRVTVVDVNADGMVDPEKIEAAIRPETRLVSVMHANHEIGTIQPIPRIAEICHRRGVLLHTDAAQSAGKVQIAVEQLDCDLLSISGHKMYAPKGIGALYVRRGVSLEPILCGAGQEAGLRPGTENVLGIVALGAAASIAHRSLDSASEKLVRLRDLLERSLEQAIPSISFNGRGLPRLPNTSSVNFPHVVGADLLARTPEICASTGSSSQASTDFLSATQSALGLPPKLARGTIRLSLGWYTEQEEIERAAQSLVAAWEALQ